MLGSVCFSLFTHTRVLFFSLRLPVSIQQCLERVLFVKLFYTLSNSTSRNSCGDTRIKVPELCTDWATDMQPFTLQWRCWTGSWKWPAVKVGLGGSQTSDGSMDEEREYESNGQKKGRKDGWGEDERQRRLTLINDSEYVCVCILPHAAVVTVIHSLLAKWGPF